MAKTVGTIEADGGLITSGQCKANGGLRVAADGTVLTKILKGTVAVDPTELAAGAIADTDIAITGAATGDIVVLCPPTTALTAGIVVGQAHVSAANTVTVRLYNTTEGAVDLASANWSYLIIKS